MKNFFILFCIFCLTSCSKLETNKDTLNINLGFEPATLDWNIASDAYSFDIISNLMVGLTRFSMNDAGEIISIPACAEKWEISTDGTEYEFYLRDIKWTDGKSVEAQEFVDSFKRILDPSMGAPYADLLSIIEKSEAIDKKALFIKLKRPAPYFIYITSYGLALPIRLDLIKKYGNKWTEPGHMVSNGAFKLKSWQHEYKIVLERNPGFDLSPHTNIRYLKFFMVPEQSSAFTLYKNNLFDFIDGRSIPNSEFKNLRNPKKIPLLRNTYIGFNMNIKPFDALLVRKAFGHGVDRVTLCEILSRGNTPNNTWIPKALKQYYNQGLGLEFNPRLASECLDQAGYTDRKTFPKVEFLIPNNKDSKLMAETLQSMWKQYLGITINIRTLEWKVYLESLRTETPPIFRMSWGADYPDPDTFMQIFTSHNQMNYGKWSNLEYDRLVMAAGSTLDKNARVRLYRNAETQLLEKDVAIVPLYINTQTILQKSSVHNLIVNPMDIVFLDKVNK